MFFILSKILFFILTPIVWIVLLLSYAVFGSNSKRKRKALIYSLVILLLFSNQFIFEEFMRMLEIEPVKIENMNTYDYGVVLGGMVFYDSENEQIVPINRSFDRLAKAIELYKKNKIQKIFISGGSGNIIRDGFIEAKVVNRYLQDIGIPEEDILYEIKSRNTHENALFTKEALSDKITDGEPILLITSSFHMRRSIACFEKLGVSVDAFPTGRYSGPRKYHFDHLVMPNINTFADWTIIIKEVIGYMVYDIVGYI